MAQDQATNVLPNTEEELIAWFKFLNSGGGMTLAYLEAHPETARVLHESGFLWCVSYDGAPDGVEEFVVASDYDGAQHEAFGYCFARPTNVQTEPLPAGLKKVVASESSPPSISPDLLQGLNAEYNAMLSGQYELGDFFAQLVLAGHVWRTDDPSQSMHGMVFTATPNSKEEAEKVVAWRIAEGVVETERLLRALDDFDVLRSA